MFPVRFLEMNGGILVVGAFKSGMSRRNVEAGGPWATFGQMKIQASQMHTSELLYTSTFVNLNIFYPRNGLF